MTLRNVVALNHGGETMAQYTTGEMAKLCNVSIRTVQFYDTKDLLKPAMLTEGGRRLYSDDDLKQMNLICLLKSLGLSLSTIKGILTSTNQNKILLMLLNEQEKQIDGEISNKQNQLKSVRIIKENIQNSDKISVNSISDIEHIMNSKKKLKKVHGIMLIVGILMDIIQIGTILLWIIKGIWLPFVIGFPFVVLMGILITRMYYKKTSYICSECDNKFRPTIKEFLFSKHTPKTRRLSCPKCGKTSYCIETYSEKK